jgi:hypothetical protein
MGVRGQILSLVALNPKEYPWNRRFGCLKIVSRPSGENKISFLFRNSKAGIPNP